MKKQPKKTLVLHRKKNLGGPVAQRLGAGHVKSVGQQRDVNGPDPA
jgi:hypothetical protein